MDHGKCCSLHVLKSQLSSGQASLRKLALKKAIASSDIGCLLAEVVRCLNDPRADTKRLAQLCVLQHATGRPDAAASAIGHLAHDFRSSEPLTRARAVRTMGYLGPDSNPDLLGGVLREALADADDYVRKTAVVGVAKLHAADPAYAARSGLVDLVETLLDDPSPMVASNAVASLSGIHARMGLPPGRVRRLLSALDQCTEWGAVFVLDALANHVPESDSEARALHQMISPQLSRKNSSIVVSAARTLTNLSEAVVADPELTSAVEEKIPGPMVGFLSAEPEIQFAVLTEIREIARRNPAAFRRHLASFFAKHDDPVYVKILKLDVVGCLVCEGNAASVLAELKGYVLDADEEFASASVAALGKCAVGVEAQSLQCLLVLKDLVVMGDSRLSQAAVVAVKDVLLAYPGRHREIAAMVCDNLPPLTCPEGKASAIWMAGEFAELADDALEILDDFLEGFLLETPMVQLKILTSTVKTYLRGQDSYGSLLTQALHLCTTEVDNPDVRNRGFFYKRLLSLGIDLAKQVVTPSNTAVHEEQDLISLDAEYSLLV